MQEDNNLLSIIIPIYKGKQHVIRLYNMIYSSQKKISFSKWDIEIIFVNDYPNELLKLPSKKEHVECKIVSDGTNHGIHGARVLGFKNAKGYYVLFLDQDDELDVDYFESQLKHVGDADAVLCNGTWRNGMRIYGDSVQMKNVFSRETFISTLGNIVSPGQVLIKRTSVPIQWTENIMKHNGSDDNMLWLLMILNNRRIVINEDILYKHVEDGNNQSFNWQSMADSRSEMYEIVKKLQVLTPEEEERYHVIIKKLNSKAYYYCKMDRLIEDIESKEDDIVLPCFEGKKTAIYGYGVFAKKTIHIIERCGVSLEYAIDQRKELYGNEEIDIYGLDDSLPIVDIVIVTPIVDIDSIIMWIHNRIGTECHIIKLVDLLDEIQKRKNRGLICY